MSRRHNTTMRATNPFKLISVKTFICAACDTSEYGPSAMQPKFCYECVQAMLHGRKDRFDVSHIKPDTWPWNKKMHCCRQIEGKCQCPRPQYTSYRRTA